jgi:hypothetical protein
MIFTSFNAYFCVINFLEQNCIGAIDGTHIDAKIKLDRQTPYRNRYGYPSQNVMAAVSFDMTFSYVAAGWEGSA